MKFLQTVVKHSLQPARHAEAVVPSPARQAFESAGLPLAEGVRNPDQSEEARNLDQSEVEVEAEQSASLSAPAAPDRPNPSGGMYAQYAQPSPAAGESAPSKGETPRDPGPDIPDLVRPRSEAPGPDRRSPASRASADTDALAGPPPSADPAARSDRSSLFDHGSADEAVAAPDPAAAVPPGQTERPPAPQQPPATAAANPLETAPQPLAQRPAAPPADPVTERPTAAGKQPEAVPPLDPSPAPAPDAPPPAATAGQRSQSTIPSGQTVEAVVHQALYPEPITASAGPPPRADEAEIPQVRIGQINVLIEDQAAPRPRSKATSAGPVAGNPFGLRGL